VIVEDEDQLYRAFRYIALNPVEAGLCRAPGDWPWSSYAALVGDARPLRLLDTEFLLRPLSENPQRGREALRKMVEDLDWPDWTPPGETRLALPSNGLVTGSDPASAPLQV